MRLGEVKSKDPTPMDACGVGRIQRLIHCKLRGRALRVGATELSVQQTEVRRRCCQKKVAISNGDANPLRVPSCLINTFTWIFVCLDGSLEDHTTRCHLGTEASQPLTLFQVTRHFRVLISSSRIGRSTTDRTNERQCRVSRVDYTCTPCAVPMERVMGTEAS